MMDLGKSGITNRGIDNSRRQSEIRAGYLAPKLIDPELREAGRKEESKYRISLGHRPIIQCHKS